MARGSARPRIESVGTFVLTVDEPAPEECPTYDAFVATPTYTLIGDNTGTGSEGTITLSDDALVMEDGGDSYVLAVVILTQGYNAPVPGIVTTVGHSDVGFSISDDGAEAVPSYLKVDGDDCFSPTWAHKTLFDGTGSTAEWDSCEDSDAEFAAAFWTYAGHVGWRVLCQTVPSGTTITFDTGASSTDEGAGIAWSAQAILIKNAAPYVYSHGVDDSYEVDAFDDGGVLFTFSVGNNDYEPPEGTCSFFDGIRAEGSAREASEGTDLLTMAQEVYVSNWHPTDGPPCFCTTNTQATGAKITITCIAAGGGTYSVDTGTLLPGFDVDLLGGLMIPGQGFY